MRTNAAQPDCVCAPRKRPALLTGPGECTHVNLRAAPTGTGQLEQRNSQLEHDVKSANNKIRLLEDEVDRVHEELAAVKKELAATLKSLDDL